MCGIAGFIGFPNKPEIATHANCLQQHRGRDNQSVWHDDYLALSHQNHTSPDINVGLEMFRNCAEEILNYLIDMVRFTIYNKEDSNVLTREHFRIKPDFIFLF